MECQGLEKFKDYFKGYEDQYVLIGGAACDILFEEREATFRKTRDLDMVIIIKMLTSEFGKRFGILLIVVNIEIKLPIKGNLNSIGLINQRLMAILE